MLRTPLLGSRLGAGVRSPGLQGAHNQASRQCRVVGPKCDGPTERRVRGPAAGEGGGEGWAPGKLAVEMMLELRLYLPATKVGVGEAREGGMSKKKARRNRQHQPLMGSAGVLFIIQFCFINLLLLP